MKTSGLYPMPEIDLSVNLQRQEVTVTCEGQGTHVAPYYDVWAALEIFKRLGDFQSTHPEEYMKDPAGHLNRIRLEVRATLFVGIDKVE